MWMTRVAINNPVFATMVMVALCVLGLFSYQRLGVEQMPDITPPVVFISVNYPGASPGAVETEVTKPLEDALNGIAGVKMIRSNSIEGRSETVVEFNLAADMTRAVQDVRDKVAGVQAGFNRDVKQPFVARFDNDNAQPTVVLALLADGRSDRELSLIADQTVRKRLTSVEGVARVTPLGLSTRQVRIDLDPQRLRAFGLTPADVSAAIARANTDQPVGLLQAHAEDSIVRVEGRIRDPKQFADIVVARNAGGGVVLLGDLGKLVEREQEPDSLSRIDGKPAITFNVYKQQDANIIRTGVAIKEAAEAMKKTLPPGVELKTVYASSDWVAQSLDGVKKTLVEGALLTIAIVFLFLHSWRSTVITGLTLPIAVIASFIAVNAFGFTLNFMTMMALSLCIGLLIDDAIVVRENIVRHVGMGQDHHTAARRGTDEIGLAVMATTFAICAVFVPVAFMKGIVGKFFFPFGITVVSAVVVSLFVSFTLDPMLSSVWRDPPAATLGRVWGVGHAMRLVDRGMAALHHVYERLIGWAFSGRRYRVLVPPVPAFGLGFDAQGRRMADGRRRWRFATLTPRGIVLWVAAATFAAAIALAATIGTEGVPQTDQSYTSLNVTMPVGTSLRRADEKVRQIEALIGKMPEIATLSSQVGGDYGHNTAYLGIGLKPRHERKLTQAQVEDEIRKRLASVPGIQVALGNQPIYIAILGPDPTVLDQITADLAAKIQKIKGVTDFSTSVKPGLPAYAVRVRPDAARQLGLTATDLAASLRAYVQGDVSTYWTTPDGQQVEVQLRLPEASRQDVRQLEQLPVAYSKDGTPIALASVASITPVTNPDIIKRQDLQRRQAIYAGVDQKSGRTTGDVNKDVQKIIDATVLPPGYRFDVGGSAKDQNEIFGNIGSALGLALIFIYIVLASQFGSFLQPVAIMASLPLSLIGVMVSLKVWGSTINLFSLIGLIMLMGLVTKNAILLVDFANHARKAGATLAEAVLTAGQIRMRPIIMTTAAMVFGMFPLALALDDGGELQAPMGRAIIGGVITSTLLTLVVVPVIYAYIEQWVGFYKHRLDAKSRGAMTGAVLVGLVGVVLAMTAVPAAGTAVVMAAAIALSVQGCLTYARANGYAPAWAAMGLGGLLGFMILAFLRPIQDGGPPEELAMTPPASPSPDAATVSSLDSQPHPAPDAEPEPDSVAA
jgi:multidrug efflux pump subunit AcrB